jgi:hypothetical protein
MLLCLMDYLNYTVNFSKENFNKKYFLSQVIKLFPLNLYNGIFL